MDEQNFEAILEEVVAATLEGEPLEDEQPTGENFDEKTRLKLRKEHLKILLRRQLLGDRYGKNDRDEDDFIAVDTHGNFDLDYDNPGPVLKRESQWISHGYIALKNKDLVSAVHKKGDQLQEGIFPGSKSKRPQDVEDAGYTSSGSEVSLDHCRLSPYYPACDDGCWLKSTEHSKDSPPEVLPQHPAQELPATQPDIYMPLAQGETRVLILEPGAESNPVVCRLEHMAIPGAATYGTESKAPKRDFIALSYAWGSPVRTHVITCNQLPFAVTTNLFHALYYLRRSDQSQCLWVDAICINQDDIPERNEQVRHMLAIYQASGRVIVWLGRAEGKGDLAVAAMNFLNVRANRHAIMRRDHGSQCVENLRQLIAVLEDFFRRPWFSRCWIRQEVSAAKRITVQCGSSVTSWNAMKRTSNTLWRLRQKLRGLTFSTTQGSTGEDANSGTIRMEQDLPLRYLKRHWVLGQSVLTTMGDIRSVWYYQTGGLMDLLMVSRLFEATDPRDKVYSVLGLAQTPIDNEPDGSPASNGTASMRIDYSASVSEVYQRAAKYLINRDLSLDILCILPDHRDGSSSADLPSWTPDWRVPTSRIPLKANFEYFTYKFGAAGFTRCSPQDPANGGKLRVRGFAVALLTQLLPLTPMSIPHPPEQLVGHAELFDPARHTRRFAMTGRGPAIVPAGAEEGDWVVVLMGCKMPVVLRHVQHDGGEEDAVTAVVVGPCFVSTIMHGEALKEFQEWAEGEMKDIVLV
jgi:hypothetical protein